MCATDYDTPLADLKKGINHSCHMRVVYDYRLRRFAILILITTPSHDLIYPSHTGKEVKNNFRKNALARFITQISHTTRHVASVKPEQCFFQIIHLYYNYDVQQETAIVQSIGLASLLIREKIPNEHWLRIYN